MSKDQMSAEAIERLYETIRSRKGTDPTVSYTAKLFSKGTAKIAQKLGEEAVETAIEAAMGDRDGVVSESADLIYHLLVLWADLGIDPDEVWTKLAEREGRSGLEEKASRKKS